MNLDSDNSFENMSNEEIVALIRQGRDDLYGLLWERVERFVRKRANRIMRIHAARYPDRAPVEFDELYNSGYIAMVEAVQTYTPCGKGFLGWLEYYLKTSFAEACNYRTRTGKSDPLKDAVSIYTTIGGDEDDITIEDSISDPEASEAFMEAEERIYAEQLHEALEGILKTIPEAEADIIRGRYFAGKTTGEMAKERGVSPQLISQKSRMGLHRIRTNTYLSKGEAFRRFLEDSSPYYVKVGVNKFMNTHTSAVEYVVLERERLEELQERKRSG